jgi:imidazolonepropionase-like amidohydrolase
MLTKEKTMTKTLKKSVFAVLAVFLTVSAYAQIPEKAEFGKFALTGGTVHTVTNGTIENGIVLIDGNKISFVGENARITADYTVIDVTGKHIFPGLIDAGTSLGLVEISAVPVTVDNAEIGDLNPHMRAFTAINPNSATIPVTRVEGVTTVVSNPASGVISGKSTMINLYGYSPDSMAVKADAGLFVNWPSSRRRGGWDQRTDEEIEKQYKEATTSMDKYLEDVRFYKKTMEAYGANNTLPKPDRNIPLEAMIPVVNGELPIIVSVDREEDILKAIEWTKTQPDLKFIFSSVAEGWRVAEELAASNIPVLVGPVLRLPTRDHDHYESAYRNPGIMHAAGVKVAIRSGDTENVRNLPFNAGYAATYGMGREDALKAITITPAEIFGVADKIGSIEEGKMANIVIANGDILEAMTQVEHVFINGFKVPNVSRHTQLFQEFLERDVR